MTDDGLEWEQSTELLNDRIISDCYRLSTCDVCIGFHGGSHLYIRSRSPVRFVLDEPDEEFKVFFRDPEEPAPPHDVGPRDLGAEQREALRTYAARLRRELEHPTSGHRSNAASGHEQQPELACTFCGKSQHELWKLIAGPGVMICVECTLLCADTFLEESEPGAR